MASPILVTGGTGTLGRLVVRLLKDAGCEIRVLSRRSHESEAGIEYVTGDLATGEGIEAAVRGTEIIMHLAGSTKGDEDKARHLIRAASAGRGAASAVHLGRRGRPDPARQWGRPCNVRLLWVQARRRAGCSRLRPTMDDAARHAVPRLAPDGGTADGKAAGDTGPGRVSVPTGRHRGGSCPARATCAWETGRPGARHGRAAGVRDGRVAARVPPGLRYASATRPGSTPRQGCPRRPGRREPGSGSSYRPADLGGVPFGPSGPVRPECGPHDALVPLTTHGCLASRRRRQHRAL